jgi:uncharacterized protein (DUF58 family)
VRSIRLTTRGRAFGILSPVLAIAAYQGGNPLLLLVAGLLGALTVTAILLARFRSMKLGVTRSFAPSPVSAMTPTTVTIDAKNLATIRSAPLYWNDTLPWRPLATDPVHLLPLAGRNGRTRRAVKLDYELTPPRRGVFSVGPLAVAYSDPFGLAVGFMLIGGKDEIIVTPHVVELPQSGVWLEAPDGAARLVQASGIGNSDDLMTREYRRGDALRRVHWRASARHGELMVRQEEQRAYPEATIVVDTRENGYPDQWGVSHLTHPGPVYSDGFEWAVAMLAALGVHLHREGFVVHIVETAERQIIAPADEESRFGREADFLLSLARVQLKRARGIPHGTTADGPVFAIISEPDAETLTWLLGMKRPFELGVVFLVGAARSVAAELNLAGWRVIPVDLHTDPSIAWRVLAEELGAIGARR